MRFLTVWTLFNDNLEHNHRCFVQNKSLRTDNLCWGGSVCIPVSWSWQSLTLHTSRSRAKWQIIVHSKWSVHLSPSHHPKREAADPLTDATIGSHQSGHNATSAITAPTPGNCVVRRSTLNTAHKQMGSKHLASCCYGSRCRPKDIFTAATTNRGGNERRLHAGVTCPVSPQVCEKRKRSDRRHTLYSYTHICHKFHH